MTKANCFPRHYLSFADADLPLQGSRNVFSGVPSGCTFFFSCLCLCVLVDFLVLLWSTCRASEQKHINVTEHLNGSFSRQLDLDLYLGVYAGEAH